MSTVEQQLLYWVLNSLSGGELPVKTTVDGSEYLVVVNPNTERVERIKNNANDTSKLWSKYTGDFTDDSGVLKLGKLDDNLTIEINSVDDEIKLKGLTEIQEARILEDLEVFGDFSTDESVRIKSNNGSLTIQYTENGDFVQELQNKDGVVALLSDIPDLNGFVPYTGASDNLDMGTNSVVTNGIETNSIEFPAGQRTRITAADTSQLTLLNLPSGSGTIARIEDLPTDDDFVTLDTGQTITGNKNFTGEVLISPQYPNLAKVNERFQFIKTNLSRITPIDAGVIFVNDNGNFQFATPYIDTLNNFELNNSNLTNDRSFIIPDKDGTLLVDEDLNNTVTFNNQNAIVVNNPDAEAVNGSITKGEILFTDSANSTSFKDFSIRKEDYQENFLVKGSRMFISEIDSNNNVTDYLKFSNGSTTVKGGLLTESISGNGRLVISNDDGEIELKDNTSGFSTKINTNLIDKNTVLQVPNDSGEIALKKTGWAQYGDTQYTSANPLVITQGNTGAISLDGLTGTVKTQLPNGSTDLYDVATSKITPIKSGDGYSLSLGFNASTNNNSGDFDIFLDIGGTFTKFKAENKTFPKGSGSVRPFMYNISAFYSGDTFINNGGEIKVTSNTGSTSLFDFDLQIHKTHDAN